MYIGLSRNFVKICTISGKCQAGKTKHAMTLINNAFTKDKKRDMAGLTDKTIVFVMTQGNKKNEKQFHSRLFDLENGLVENVDPNNIKRIKDIGDIDTSKNAVVVSFHHDTREKKFKDFMERNKDKYGCVVLTIDEVDCGNEAGVEKRIAFVQDIVNITRPILPYIKVITMTATPKNFNSAMVNLYTTPSKVRMYPVLRDFSLRDNTYIYPIVETDEYRDVSQMLAEERIDVIQTEKTRKMSASTFKELRENEVFAKIKAAHHKFKKYAYMLLSLYKKDHVVYADRILEDETGFNVCMIMNCDGGDDIDCRYISTANRSIKKITIPMEKIKKQADEGKLARRSYTANNGRTVRRDTGINNSSDISVTDIVSAIFFQLAHLNASNPKKQKLRLLLEKTGISEIDDFPRFEEANVMLIGGKSFDRGSTFQDTNTKCVFTMGIVVSTNQTNDASFGAVNYQRSGRMFGNVSETLSQANIETMYITDKKVLNDMIVNAKLNESIVETLADSIIRAKQYADQGRNCLVKEKFTNVIPDSVYANVCKVVKRIHDDYIQNARPNMYNTEVDDSASETSSTDDDGENVQDEQVELTEEQAKVRVEITDQFRAKMLRHYHSSSSFVPKALRCLKNFDRPVSLFVFAVEMSKLGYTTVDRIRSNAMNAGEGGQFRGYWNYSLADEGWIYMPQAIKDLLD